MQEGILLSATISYVICVCTSKLVFGSGDCGERGLHSLVSGVGGWPAIVLN